MHHFYASPWIDRADHRRTDEDFLSARFADARARLIPVWKGLSLLRSGEDPAAVEVTVDQLAIAPSSEDRIFLGMDGDGRACFAVSLPDDLDPLFDIDEEVEFADLRRAGPVLDAHQAGLLAYARAIVHWHGTNRFCGSCGGATEARAGGWLRACLNRGCEIEHHPRTDPAVIVRVAYGDQILLARQASWPKKWYSVLAGFVEPGESLEDAVAREVLEEVGVVLRNIRYGSSQPWPFPASLMVGFAAEAESYQLLVDDRELEDARWFDREQIATGLEEGTLRLSPKVSISRHLIDEWLDLAPRADEA